MPLLPSADTFRAHGLTNIELSLQLPSAQSQPGLTPSPVYPFHPEEWISGHAKFVVTPDYPLISKESKSYPRISFTFCASNDQGSMSRFRRQAQLLALDSLPSKTGTSKGHQFAHVKEVLAWWEDIHGLWLITEEEDVDRVRKPTGWRRVRSSSC
jgi:hypothetical protein